MRKARCKPGQSPALPRNLELQTCSLHQVVCSLRAFRALHRSTAARPYFAVIRDGKSDYRSPLPVIPAALICERGSRHIVQRLPSASDFATQPASPCLPQAASRVISTARLDQRIGTVLCTNVRLVACSSSLRHQFAFCDVPKRSVKQPSVATVSPLVLQGSSMVLRQREGRRPPR